jgi:FAD synthase
VRYLRSEKKFENIESLQDQIRRDVAQARAIFAT